MIIPSSLCLPNIFSLLCTLKTWDSNFFFCFRCWFFGSFTFFPFSLSAIFFVFPFFRLLVPFLCLLFSLSFISPIFFPSSVCYFLCLLFRLFSSLFPIYSPSGFEVFFSVLFPMNRFFSFSSQRVNFILIPVFNLSLKREMNSWKKALEKPAKKGIGALMDQQQSSNFSTSKYIELPSRDQLYAHQNEGAKNPHPEVREGVCDLSDCLDKNNCPQRCSNLVLVWGHFTHNPKFNYQMEEKTVEYFSSKDLQGKEKPQYLVSYTDPEILPEAPESKINSLLTGKFLKANSLSRYTEKFDRLKAKEAIQNHLSNDESSSET